MFKIFRYYFENLTDSRRSGSIRHEFFDILFIAVITILCSGEGFEEMHRFAKYQRKWFEKYIKLSGGIPSADTFSRVLNLIDPSEFSKSFTGLFKSIAKYSGIKIEESHVAIDGKNLRGSRHLDEDGNKEVTHIVNALNVNLGISIGQVKVDKEQYVNEISAILDILDIIDLKGTMITIDGISNKKITKKIREKGGNYTVVLKENNKNLYKAVRERMLNEISSLSPFEEEDKYRNILRKVYVMDVKGIDDSLLFQDAKTIIYYQHLEKKNKEYLSDKLFLSSKKLDTEEAYKYVRGHWNIENNLHWVLDVNFNEDKSKIRKGNAPAVLSAIRKLTYNILKMNKDKISLKGKVRRAVYDIEFREKLISDHITNWAVK